jgi:hypothetical protein
MEILHYFAKLIIAPVIITLGLAGYQVTPTNIPQPIESPELGAALPQTPANFETSLQTAITSSATSMTLTANSVRGGGALSGYNCFTVDEGTAQSEFICGAVSGTSVTSLTRGVSPLTGTTTVASLQFAHRRGANVKVTDFPTIQILKAQNNGEDTFPSALSYATTSTSIFTQDQHIVTKKYVDDTAFSGAGVVDGTSSARGVVELATGVEIASSTSVGGSGNLVIPASLATSTYNSATAALRVVVTKNSGKIDDNFISTTTIFAGGMTIGGTSNVASSSMVTYTASTTPTTTWTKPSNLKYVVVEVVGGGGGGGGSEGNASGGGGGGGAGAYCKKIVSSSVLGATETVTVGGGGAGVTSANGGLGATSSFGAHCVAGGGVGGASHTGGGGGQDGGTATGGDLNIVGGTGSNGGGTISGRGGNSMYGQGAGAVVADSGGLNATGYGGGGSGSFGDSSSSAQAGGSGSVGIVIVTQYFY